MTPSIEDHIGFVKRTARNYARQTGRYHLVEDFEQAAAEGWLRAFSTGKYDPARGAITTFAYPSMIAAMQRVRAKVGDQSISLPGNASRIVGDGPTIRSLDQPVGEGGQLGDFVGDIDDGYAAVETRVDVEAILDRLPPELARTATVLMECEMNMAEAGRRLGISRSAVLARLNQIRDLA